MIKDLIKQIDNLKPYQFNDLMFELFKAGKINYVEFSKYYVQVLEADNIRLNANIKKLALMLSFYADMDKTKMGKTARQHLYNSGAYTENDGSDFGKKLYKEFKEQQNV